MNMLTRQKMVTFEKMTSTIDRDKNAIILLNDPEFDIRLAISSLLMYDK